MTTQLTHYDMAELIIIEGMPGELILDNCESHIAYLKERADELFPSEDGSGPFGHCPPMQTDILFVGASQSARAAMRLDFEACPDPECTSARAVLTLFPNPKEKGQAAHIIEASQTGHIWNSLVAALTVFTIEVTGQLWGEE